MKALLNDLRPCRDRPRELLKDILEERPCPSPWQGCRDRVRYGKAACAAVS